MPHSDVHWKQMILTLEKNANHEKVAAGEWKQVADRRLSYLSAFDKALSLILARATNIVKVFDASAPAEHFASLPAQASGEEVARSCRDKLVAMTMFTENLAQSAMDVEHTLRDVYALASAATATLRPETDTVPSTMADDIVSGLSEVTEYHDNHSPVTASAPSPSFRERSPSADPTAVPLAEEPVDFMALINITR